MTARPGAAPLDAVGVAVLTTIVLALATTSRSIAAVPALVFVTVIIADRLWSEFVLRRTALTATAQPGVIALGQPVQLRLARQGTRLPARRFVAADTGPSHAFGAELAVVEIVPSQVGVIHQVDITLIAVSLGFTSARQKRRVDLTRPLLCGPRLDVPVDLDTLHPPAGSGLSATRHYIPGDRPNRINWPATARTGALLVRSEAVDEPEMIVVEVSMADEGPLGWLSGPGSFVMEWWRRHGTPVRLITRQVDTPWVGPSAGPSAGPAESHVVDAIVDSEVDLLTRLAQVQAGPLEVAGVGDDPSVVRFVHGGAH